MQMDRKRVLTDLRQAVTEVGDLLLQWHTSGGVDGTWEGPQFKAEADKWAHQALTERLFSILPGVAIISEEDAGSLVKPRPDLYWLIDPIDGTASYVGGFTGYVTQAALMDSKGGICAAIYAPALQQLYSAARHGGAFRNEEAIMTKIAVSGKRTIVDNYPEPRGSALVAFKEYPFDKYVESGSISLKICRVAEGEADLFFKDVAVRDWDLGAPQLVLEEAGGHLTDLDGGEIAYLDTYEHEGMIAAASEEEAQNFRKWYRQRFQETVGS